MHLFIIVNAPLVYCYFFPYIEQVRQKERRSERGRFERENREKERRLCHRREKREKRERGWGRERERGRIKGTWHDNIIASLPNITIVHGMATGGAPVRGVASSPSVTDGKMLIRSPTTLANTWRFGEQFYPNAPSSVLARPGAMSALIVATQSWKRWWSMVIERGCGVRSFQSTMLQTYKSIRPGTKGPLLRTF